MIGCHRVVLADGGGGGRSRYIRADVLPFGDRAGADNQRRHCNPAEALGDVSDRYIWCFPRWHKIDLLGRTSRCPSNDSDFVHKAAEIVGLSLAPPEDAIVLAVDESEHVNAIGSREHANEHPGAAARASVYLKLKNRRSLVGHGHTCKRHSLPRTRSGGRTTYFATLIVATGEVQTRHYTANCLEIPGKGETAGWTGRQASIIRH